MTPQQQRHVEAQKIVEGSPIGVRTPDIISGLSLAKLFDERDEFRAALAQLELVIRTHPKGTTVMADACARAQKALTVP